VHGTPYKIRVNPCRTKGMDSCSRRNDRLGISVHPRSSAVAPSLCVSASLREWIPVFGWHRICSICLIVEKQKNDCQMWSCGGARGLRNAAPDRCPGRHGFGMRIERLGADERICETKPICPAGQTVCTAHPTEPREDRLRRTKPICRDRLETGDRRWEATADASCRTKPISGPRPLPRDDAPCQTKPISGPRARRWRMRRAKQSQSWDARMDGNCLLERRLR
jgi:hypothetical protein